MRKGTGLSDEAFKNLFMPDFMRVIDSSDKKEEMRWLLFQIRDYLLAENAEQGRAHISIIARYINELESESWN